MQGVLKQQYSTYKRNLSFCLQRSATGRFDFHSDRGCNYTSATFRLCLAELKVKQSFSNPGNPYNNSVMESFFKSMKTERLYRTDFRSEREFREAVKQHITFYNEKRPHSVLRYRTPNKCEDDYVRKQAALQKI